MKAINAQGAVPTMADNFIMYSGEIDNSSGALSDGTSLLVPITTEIRQLLIVKAQCFQSTDRTPSFSDRKFDANFKVEETSSGTKTITIEVPSGCLCNYQISGDKSIGTITHFEQAIGVGVADPQHAGGHRHDGNDSKKISYADLLNNPLAINNANVGKYLKTVSGPAFDWQYTPNCQIIHFRASTLPSSDNFMEPAGEEGIYLGHDAKIKGIYLSQNAGATQGLINLTSSPVSINSGNYTIKVSDSGGGQWRVDILVFTGGVWTDFYMITDDYSITVPFNVTIALDYNTYIQNH